MANTVQHRRGSTVSINSYSGAAGEFVYNTTTKRIHAMDGSTFGGAAHALVSDLDSKANSSVTISAGTGLTGGGSLAANRTIALSSTSIASLGKADTAVQPGSLATVATSGAYNDLSGRPVAGQFVPSGGAAGQVLVKSSAANYDTQWSTSAAATSVSYAPQTLSPSEQGQARENIGVGTHVANVTALKALDPTKDMLVYLTEPGREGQFIWRTGDFSAQVAADTEENVYVEADDVAATVGAWVRAPLAGKSASGEVQYQLYGDAYGGFASSAFHYEIGTIEDAPALNQSAYAAIRINDDRRDMTTNGSGSKVDGLNVIHYFGGPNTRGGRHAIQGNAFLKAPTESNNEDRFYVGVQGQFVAQTNDGGTTGARKGDGFGGSFYAELNPGVTGWRNLTGAEFNTIVPADANLSHHCGIQIVSTVQGHGTVVDAAISISGLGAAPVDGFRDVIHIGLQNGNAPIGPGSTIIRCDIDCGVIIDHPSVYLGKSTFEMGSTVAGVLLGSKSAASTPYIDFFGNGGTNRLGRIIMSGGNGAAVDIGDLTLSAGTVRVPNIYVDGKQVVGHQQAAVGAAIAEVNNLAGVVNHIRNVLMNHGLMASL